MRHHLRGELLCPQVGRSETGVRILMGEYHPGERNAVCFGWWPHRPHYRLAQTSLARCEEVVAGWGGLAFCQATVGGALSSFDWKAFLAGCWNERDQSSRSDQRHCRERLDRITVHLELRPGGPVWTLRQCLASPSRSLCTITGFTQRRSFAEGSTGVRLCFCCSFQSSAAVNTLQSSLPGPTGWHWSVGGLGGCLSRAVQL